MSADVALTDHIAALGQACKTDTNQKLLAFNTAVTQTFQEMDNAKANKSQIATLEAFLTNSGLYVDNDGDVCQLDEEET